MFSLRIIDNEIKVSVCEDTLKEINIPVSYLHDEDDVFLSFEEKKSDFFCDEIEMPFFKGGFISSPIDNKKTLETGIAFYFNISHSEEQPCSKFFVTDLYPENRGLFFFLGANGDVRGKKNKYKKLRDRPWGKGESFLFMPKDGGEEDIFAFEEKCEEKCLPSLAFFLKGDEVISKKAERNDKCEGGIKISETNLGRIDNPVMINIIPAQRAENCLSGASPFLIEIWGGGYLIGCETIPPLAPCDYRISIGGSYFPDMEERVFPASGCTYSICLDKCSLPIAKIKKGGEDLLQGEPINYWEEERWETLAETLSDGPHHIEAAASRIKIEINSSETIDMFYSDDSPVFIDKKCYPITPPSECETFEYLFSGIFYGSIEDIKYYKNRLSVQEIKKITN
jgi:hypothetical protein